MAVHQLQVFDKLVEMDICQAAGISGHKADIFTKWTSCAYALLIWPEKIKAGTSQSATISQTDFMATFADLVGI